MGLQRVFKTKCKWWSDCFHQRGVDCVFFFFQIQSMSHMNSVACQLIVFNECSHFLSEQAVEVTSAALFYLEKMKLNTQIVQKVNMNIFCLVHSLKFCAHLSLIYSPRLWLCQGKTLKDTGFARRSNYLQN